MDWSGFGSMVPGAGMPGGMPGAGMMGGGAAPGGGMLAAIQKLMNPAAQAAPAVPPDGSMQPTIGPGAAPPAPAAPPYKPALGLPKGGLLGIMQGGNPQGLAGLLQHLTAGQPQPGAPLAGAMPQAGMLPGMPGSPMAGPVAPPPPQLPTDINPMNQF